MVSNMFVLLLLVYGMDMNCEKVDKQYDEFSRCVITAY